MNYSDSDNYTSATDVIEEIREFIGKSLIDIENELKEPVEVLLSKNESSIEYRFYYIRNFKLVFVFKNNILIDIKQTYNFI